MNNQEGLYKIDFSLMKKIFSCWSYPKESFILSKGWVKPNPTHPSEVKVKTLNNSSQKLNECVLIQRSVLQDISDEHFLNVNINDVLNIFYNQIISFVERKLPRCIYWKYSDSFLLPAQLNLEIFEKNPESCIPLKNMFILAGYTDIPNTIKIAKNRQTGLRNLLNKISTCSTNHLRAVWKDFKNVKIVFEPNGVNIDASIHDKYNRFDFSKRSDGFKRFVSFLFLVSAPVKSKQISNTLYLYDEPDTCLHPSGEKCLLKELIKISRNNYVVFSTHSIFMIDHDLINRHLIVEKNAEITTVHEAGPSDITDEEVIFKALGYSIFENLKKKNIIFEGWRDKNLFLIALNDLPINAKRIFSEIGFCHAHGVKEISHITKILELAKREWIVISDGDSAAIQQQNAYKGKGPWFRYDELLPKYKPVTGEDFIKPRAFKNILKSITQKNPTLNKFDIHSLSCGIKKLDVIKSWLCAGSIPENIRKEIIEEIKESVFNSIEPTQIDQKYFELLSNIQKKLK